MQFFTKLFSNVSKVSLSNALTVALPVLAVAGTVGVKTYQDHQAAAMNAMSQECPYMQCPMGEMEDLEGMEGDWAMCEFDSATLASFDWKEGNTNDAVVSDVKALPKNETQHVEQIKMPTLDCIVPLIYPEPELSQAAKPNSTLDSNTSVRRIFVPGQNIKTTCFIPQYLTPTNKSVDSVQTIASPANKGVYYIGCYSGSLNLTPEQVLDIQKYGLDARWVTYDTTYIEYYDIMGFKLDATYIDQVDSTPPINLYPNPANGMSGATLEGVISGYTLTDAQGRVITRQRNVSSDRTPIGQGLTPGRYMLVVTLPNGKVETRTLVIGD